MADMRLEDKNNQAREIIAARSKVYATNASGDLFNLPINSVVKEVVVAVTKADSTADGTNPSTLEVDINGTSVGSVNTNAAGIARIEVADIAGYAKTGGVLSIVPGNAKGDGEMFIIAEIVENNTTGAYLG
jgi:hypothetical protein